MGFTQEEKEMIGLIARYHRKGIAATKRYHCRNLSPQDLTRVNFLAAVLRMAVAINRTRLYRVLDTVVQWQPDQLTVTLFHHPNDSIEVETHKLESERPFLEKAFQAKFVIKTEELKNG
jgi:exopolyphosphatase/guanosine-5'-triphosphate,3'-diphosphate pyrophosphatase